ncbi:MAG: phytanoyl-CoA dioxygenase family protein [Acidimicrobiales bacterium]
MSEAIVASSDHPADPALTPQQRAFFEAFGFLRIPGTLASEIAEITEAFDAVVACTPAVVDVGELNVETMGEALTRAGRIDSYHHLHQGRHRAIIPDFLERDPVLERLVRDPRITGPVAALLGPDVEYFGSDGNVLDCDTSWHCDVYGSPIEQYHVKALVYLDELDETSGALRAIPGTNWYTSEFARRMQQDLSDWATVEDIFGVPHDEIPSVAVPSRPGDLILLNFRTMHATFNGRDGRRLFTLNFRQPATPAPAD